MKHTIDDLRDILFDTLADLRNKGNPMDLDRAHAIVQVGKALIDSAKTEVQFMKVTGADGTGFIQKQLPDPQAQTPGKTVHKLR